MSERTLRAAKAALATYLKGLRDGADPSLRSGGAVEVRTGIPRSSVDMALRGDHTPSRDTVESLVRLWGGDLATALSLRGRAALLGNGGTTMLTREQAQARAVVGELLLALLERGMVLDPPEAFTAEECRAVLHEVEVIALRFAEKAEAKSRLAVRGVNGDAPVPVASVVAAW